MSVEVHPTSFIEDGAQIGKNVEIGPYCLISKYTVIGDNCILKGHVNISGHTMIGSNNTFYPYATIGTEPQDLGYKGEPTRLEIGDGNVFREFVSINRGTTKENQVTLIGNNNTFMAYAHVGHDVVIEDHAVIVNSVNLAGHVKIGSRAIVGGSSSVSQFVTIGRGAYVGGASAVDRDIPPFCTAYGNRVKLKGINIVGLRRQGLDKATISELVEFYRDMEASALSPRAFVLNEETMRDFQKNDIVGEVSEFIANSDIGIAPFIS